MTISELLKICEKEYQRGMKLSVVSEFDEGYYHAFRLCSSLIKCLDEHYTQLDGEVDKLRILLKDYADLSNNILEEANRCHPCFLCVYSDRNCLDEPCINCFSQSKYVCKYENKLKLLHRRWDENT